MFLVIDNYDSFTYNLVQYLGEMGVDPVVCRNDAISVDEALALGPEAIVISPGPGLPADAGVCVALVRQAFERCPILGVCLGHQVIGAAFGAKIESAPRLMHGKTSLIHHDATGVFAGLPSPTEAMRYHSLVVAEASIPEELTVNAWTQDASAPREVMGFRHRDLHVHGVQFHPESVGTTAGKNLIRTFVESVRD